VARSARLSEECALSVCIRPTARHCAIRAAIPFGESLKGKMKEAEACQASEVTQRMVASSSLVDTTLCPIVAS